MQRCTWVNGKNKEYIEYHDTEWGIPVYDDYKLFEMLILEWVQAGLSWETILKRRWEYRKAFNNFDFKKVAKYDDKKREELLQNEGIIRNKLKIKSAIKNAQVFLEIQKEFWSFSEYIWWFTNNKIIKNRDDFLTQTDISKKISKDLQQRGMSFVWPTIIYAFMQAVGIVNNHTKDCFLS